VRHHFAAKLGMVSLVGALSGLIGAERDTNPTVQPTSDDRPAPVSRSPSGTTTGQQSFVGVKGGDEREVGGIKLCWCPPGRFLMGSPAGEVERRPDETQVEVRLTRGFWASKYEVTQSQWKRVMGPLPGAQTGGSGDDFPVCSVNYAEAEAFCRALTEQARASGNLPKEWEFRLPTEAQWEYACRAGTTTATAFGDKLSSKQANFGGKPYNGAAQGPSLKRAARVGSYPANAWGLHDMHGNAFEWCRDWSHRQLPGGDDPDLSSIKGTMNRDGTVSRVRRGGCWADEGWPCRSASRLRFEPDRRSDHIGFRIVAVRP
jgi:formylglycine-generating enzyme